jgi:FAD binding domain
MSFGSGAGSTGMTSFADTSSDTAARRLRRSFRGPVHQPGDARYDEQRATWSGSLAATPAIVAEALTPADVREAVAVAREHDLALAVQSTGHGTHVHAQGGLLLKTARMAGVLVDPSARTARVGGGATWGDVVAAAAPFGLAPVSGSNPTVGVAGFTLGGGVGSLSRKHGLGADNLLRAEVVTADGRIVTASAGENPDLFWALRGGGGNFGVVTSLEVRLHEVAGVLGGEIRFARERAAAVLAAFRDGAEARPDALTVTVGLTPEHVSLRLVFAGDPADGVAALRPLLDAGGAPLHSDVRPMPYADVTTIPGTPPRSFHLFGRLGDAVLEAAVEAPVDGLEVRQWGGAIAAGDGPAGHRDVPFSITVAGDAPALARRATGGSFLNFLHDPARTHTAYTREDWRALSEVKAIHDPDNVFATNMNVEPGTPAAGRAAA